METPSYPCRKYDYVSLMAGDEGSLLVKVLFISWGVCCSITVLEN